MNRKQAQRQNMIHTTIGYCESHASSTAVITAFAPAFTSAKNLFAQIGPNVQVVLARTAGATENARVLRQQLVTAALKCSFALVGYANTIADAILRQKVGYSKSELERLKKEDLNQACQTIQQMAADNLSGAGSYGYTAADVTALADAITAYEAVQQAPRSSAIEVKVANEQIDNLQKHIISDIFKKQLDKMITTLVENDPQFVSGYFSAREILDLPTSTTLLSGLVTDESTGLPLDGVDVRLNSIEDDTLRYKTTTTPDGRFSISPVTPGDYSLTLAKSGYTTIVDALVHFSPGESLEQEILMSAI